MFSTKEKYYFVFDCDLLLHLGNGEYKQTSDLNNTLYMVDDHNKKRGCKL